MTNGNIAEIAALVGDPGRANMLAALLDGRALTATELAGIAGVTPATASGHLGKLTDGKLLAAAAQGRHRYYRLASTEVARMLESIMLVAGPPADLGRATPRVPSQLREARTFYLCAMEICPKFSFFVSCRTCSVFFRRMTLLSSGQYGGRAAPAARFFFG